MTALKKSMLFDLSTHLNQNAPHLFYDEKTYADLFKEIIAFHSHFLKINEEFFGLQIQSPYESFAAILGAMAAGKTAVMISPLEIPEGINRLQTQVPFKTVLKDSDKLITSSLAERTSLEIQRERASLIVFSSGSSGMPKGIALTFDNLYYSALGFIEFVSQSKSDISLMNLPHHHVGGLMTLWRAFFSGSSLISNPDKDFDIISLVPLQLARALEDQQQLTQLKKCRIILVGGAKLTPELLKKATEPDLKLYETYGMSETTSLVCLNGEVLPYREVNLNQDHFFQVKGKTLSPGFYKNHIFQPIPVDQEGWYKTNDVGELKNERFSFSHRADIVFISGGENINPLLIEDILRTHPEISDAYVLPVEDEQWGHRGVCLYELKKTEATLDEEVLKSFLKNHIHPFHIPKNFFQTELKSTGQLKPKRHELIKKAQSLYLKHVFSYSWKEKPHAPVIVFLHGFTGSKEDFEELGNSFAETHSILTVDLPGHGRTNMQDFLSTHDLLLKLSTFISLFSDSPVLYGYSMGGRVALQLALHFLSPSLLILESAGPGLDSKEEAEMRKKADSEMFSSFSSTDEFINHWYKQDLFKQYFISDRFKKDRQMKKLHDLNEWQKSQAIFSQGSFPLKKENLNELKEKSFPVFYIYGSEDVKYKAYAPLFERSYEITGASHNPHKTHLAELTTILKTILK